MILIGQWIYAFGLFLMCLYVKFQESDNNNNKQTLLEIWNKSWTEATTPMSLYLKQLQSDTVKSTSKVSWDYFLKSPSAEYALLINESSQSPITRNRLFNGWILLSGNFMISDGTQYQEFPYSYKYWCAYMRGDEIVVIFTGSGGNLEGALTHPSSPIRRARDSSNSNEEIYFLPYLGFIENVASTLTGSQFINIVGFSMGGLCAQLAMTMYGDREWLKNCYTFNTVMLFIPNEFSSLVTFDDELISQKTINWRVGLDPLSGSLELIGHYCAIPFGTTFDLPPKHSLNILANHKLDHYLQ